MILKRMICNNSHLLNNMPEILIFVLFLDMVLVYESSLRSRFSKIGVMTSPRSTMPSRDGFKDCHIILNVILYIIVLGQMQYHCS